MGDHDIAMGCHGLPFVAFMAGPWVIMISVATMAVPWVGTGDRGNPMGDHGNPVGDHGSAMGCHGMSKYCTRPPKTGLQNFQ